MIVVMVAHLQVVQVAADKVIRAKQMVLAVLAVVAEDKGLVHMEVILLHQEVQG
jgi:hypothetical protein